MPSQALPFLSAAVVKFLSDTRLQTNELPVFSCPQPHPSTFFDEHRERISLRLYSYGSNRFSIKEKRASHQASNESELIVLSFLRGFETHSLSGLW